MKSACLVGVVIACLLAGRLSQQVVTEKVVLPKTVLSIGSGYNSINGVVYRRFTTNLYLGDEDVDKTPVQKVLFGIEFNGEIMAPLKYGTTVTQGVKTLESSGFAQVSTTSRSLDSRGISYSTYEFQAHMRLDASHKMDAKVAKSKFNVIDESAKWVQNQNHQAGILQLGYASTFWANLFSTYKSDKAEGERIPVSWSLNPKDEALLFDSKASYIGETFVFNGFRATGKQYGMKSSVSSGTWYYPSMDFKMGDKWSIFDQTVCVDPNADTIIGLPTNAADSVWKIIQDDICAGNSTSSCDYSRATIDKMTPFEISLATSKVTGLGQVAPPKFESHVKLQGKDVIKKSTDDKFLRYGLAYNSGLSTVCNKNNIILGRWFFTKVEMTMWAKSSTDIVLSFSNIEKENQQQKDANAAAGLGALIVIGIILIIVVVVAAGVAVFKKVSGGNDGYVAPQDADVSIGKP